MEDGNDPVDSDGNCAVRFVVVQLFHCSVLFSLFCFCFSMLTRH